MRVLVMVFVWIGGSLVLPAHANFLCMPPLSGSVTGPGFERCMEVLGFGDQIERIGDASSGGGQQPRPVFGPLKILKPVDEASPGLRLSLATGRVFETATLTLRTTCGNSQVPYYQILLENAQVVGTSATAAAEPPTEQVALNYEKITWTYTSYDDSCQVTGEASEGWDVQADTGI